MRIFPTKNQWKNWSLPSKITYISFCLTIFFAIFTIFITLSTFYCSNKYAKESDRPKLSIKLKNKPYLRYEVKDKEIELSYELWIRNKGKNTAEDIRYSKLIQKLVVGTKVVADVNSTANPNPPRKLITQDEYYQILRAKSDSRTDNQIKSIISDYNSEKLAVILEIEIEYKDSITSKKHSVKEVLKIYKSRVEIL